jgi:ER membrane protein complex subunit 3
MALLLDPAIRDWVVLPLFVIMIAAGLLRHYVSQLLQGSRTKVGKIPQRTQSKLRQVTKLRSGAAHYMSTWKFHARKQHYAKLLQEEAEWAKTEHELQQQQTDGDDDDDPFAAMMNPMGMMKGNMVFMVQNMVMMQGIQHFFSGFVLLKVPFPLTTGFKSMFQKGMMELPDLESSYVSSISWYFLVMYGLRSFFRLAIGDPPLEVKEQDMLLTQMGMQMPNPAAAKGQDTDTIIKQLKQESENLELLMQDHKSELDSVEKRLLGANYPKRRLGADSDGDFLGKSFGATKVVGTKKKK